MQTVILFWRSLRPASDIRLGYSSNWQRIPAGCTLNSEDFFCEDSEHELGWDRNATCILPDHLDDWFTLLSKNHYARAFPLLFPSPPVAVTPYSKPFVQRNYLVAFSYHLSPIFLVKDNRLLDATTFAKNEKKSKPPRIKCKSHIKQSLKNLCGFWDSLKHDQLNTKSSRLQSWPVIT